ncbi:MAG: TolB family protein [Phycisphaerales bacterium]
MIDSSTLRRPLAPAVTLGLAALLLGPAGGCTRTWSGSTWSSRSPMESERGTRVGPVVLNDGWERGHSQVVTRRDVPTPESDYPGDALANGTSGTSGRPDHGTNADPNANLRASRAAALAASQPEHWNRRGTPPGGSATTVGWDQTTAVDVPAGDVRFADPIRQPVDPSLRPGNDTRSTRFADAAMVYGHLADGLPRDAARTDGSASLIQITTTELGHSIMPTISADGTAIAYTTTEHTVTGDIYVRAIGQRRSRQVTRDPSDDTMPAFSPDGTMIAFASDREGNYDIYETSVTGGPVTRITDDPDPSYHPSYSPDGTRIAYCRQPARTGRWEIWMYDRASGQQSFIAHGMFPEWSPDPARPAIVFQRARQRGSRLFGVWMIEFDASGPSNPIEIVSAANAACMHPTWSPDARSIAFSAVPETELARPGRPLDADIWVIGVDGEQRVQLTRGRTANMFPAWAADGSVFFTSDRSGADNLWAIESARTLLGDRSSVASGGGGIGAANDRRMTATEDNSNRMPPP